MQRYQPRHNPKHFQSDLMQPCESGSWVRADEAQAEIDALHKECDRLTALLGKPKVLEAHELTEPGWYWHIWPLQKEWKIVRVHPIGQAAGQFIGPLKQPEV